MDNTRSSVRESVTGSVLVLIQFDVCEELQLDLLRQTVSARFTSQTQNRQAIPGYVRYERPPVIEPIESLVLESGEQLTGELKYFDYGIVSVGLRLGFSSDWDRLVQLASRWVWELDIVSQVQPLVRQRLEHAAHAMVKQYSQWLSEDYFIFHAREVTGAPSAEVLMREHGMQIAQLVRGERSLLSDAECGEVLNSHLSYYPSDVVVIGWNAAFVYDTTAGAETAIQMLEYANSQLLEFRHYDELLTGVLDGVYHSIQEKRGVFARWNLARSASELHAVLLEIGELTERADNAIKFLSDMFAARLYKLAAAKVGVPDYKTLVTRKLSTAEDLYQFLLERFNQARTFFLEAMVVLILLIELFYVFRGQVL